MGPNYQDWDRLENSYEPHHHNLPDGVERKESSLDSRGLREEDQLRPRPSGEAKSESSTTEIVFLRNSHRRDAGDLAVNRITK